MSFSFDQYCSSLRGAAFEGLLHYNNFQCTDRSELLHGAFTVVPVQFPTRASIYGRVLAIARATIDAVSVYMSRMLRIDAMTNSNS